MKPPPELTKDLSTPLSLPRKVDLSVPEPSLPNTVPEKPPIPPVAPPAPVAPYSLEAKEPI
jgi:hypothetical protein